MNDLKVPDNFHADFPARMADGRFMTDFTSNCILNTLRKEKMSAWEYRTHLINNAEQIMQQINEKNESMYGCQECHRTVLPAPNAKQVCTDSGCEIVNVEDGGIGLA
tara:strand:+ start:15 stop:335 length:321 start_codon:yes stop_codon:yes gene_type:complete